MTADNNPKAPKVNRGKGISISLLSQTNSPGGGHEVNPNTAIVQQEEKVIQEIPLSLITPDPTQPRKKFDPVKVKQLSQIIESKGLQQPVLVRPHGSGYYLISGENRFRAHQLLGKEKILCIVRTISDKGEILLLQLSENVHRTDLTPIETAEGIARLAEIEGITFKEAALQLYLTKNQIIEYSALVGAPEEVKELQTLGITNDRRTLYEADKLHRTNPELAEKVIADLKVAAKSGDSIPNVRKALQTAIKQTKEPASVPVPVTSQATPIQPDPTPNLHLLRSSVREEGGNYRLTLTMSDGSTISFLSDERASKDLMDSFTVMLF